MSYVYPLTVKNRDNIRWDSTKYWWTTERGWRRNSTRVRDDDKSTPYSVKKWTWDMIGDMKAISLCLTCPEKTSSTLPRTAVFLRNQISHPSSCFLQNIADHIRLHFIIGTWRQNGEWRHQKRSINPSSREYRPRQNHPADSSNQWKSNNGKCLANLNSTLGQHGTSFE